MNYTHFIEMCSQRIQSTALESATVEPTSSNGGCKKDEISVYL